MKLNQASHLSQPISYYTINLKRYIGSCVSLVNKQCLKFRYFYFESYDETTVLPGKIC